MLPLDLHVLSLPLAFILSQDQTLHCKFVFTLFARPVTLIRFLLLEINVLLLYFFVVLVLPICQ